MSISVKNTLAATLSAIFLNWAMSTIDGFKGSAFLLDLNFCLSGFFNEKGSRKVWGLAWLFGPMSRPSQGHLNSTPKAVISFNTPSLMESIYYTKETNILIPKSKAQMPMLLISLKNMKLMMKCDLCYQSASLWIPC